MNKSIVAIAFGLGAIAVLWMAAIFVGTNTLALAITLVIGAAYLLGFIEMRQYRAATATLTQALDRLQGPLDNLNDWLQQLHPTLCNPVQTRIEGERIALPGPVLTPYLVGLLVMLGLLGTFVGMVGTLQGAVAALQGSSELQAIREGLAAPIEGLSIAFGTSVAGIAASAMLGLISTVSRRERMLQTRRLDQQIAGALREFSLVHNRQQTYKALQMQATALPDVANRMNTLADKLEQMGSQLGSTLRANQTDFQQTIEHRFTALANAVEQSLKNSIADGGKRTAESIEPIVKAAMASIADGLSDSARSIHHTLLHNSQHHLDNIATQLAQTTQAWLQQQADENQLQQQQLRDFLKDMQLSTTQQQTATTECFKSELETISQQQNTAASALLTEVGRLLESSDTLIQARTASEAQWLNQQTAKMDTLTQALQSGLSDLINQEEQRSDAAVARLAQLEATVSEQLIKLGAGLEAPMTQLIATASETPKAAAEVISQLRNEISNNIARDNQLLAERQLLMEKLNTLANALQLSSGNHSQLLEQLMKQSAETLNTVGVQFRETVAGETEKLSDMAAQFAGSASEIASLGDAFGAAVQQFNDSSTQLIDTLSRIEQTLEQAGARSDEQLGYYVAQAREIIDHSIHSQRQLIDELRQRSQQEALFAEAVD